MASIQETLRAALGSDTALADLVADRIYPGQVPDDEAETPWLFYAVPSQTPNDDLDGGSDAQAEVEFHSLADDYATAKAILDRVYAILNTYQGGQISRAFWRMTTEDFTEEGYHHVSTYLIFGSNPTLITTGGAIARITTNYNAITLTAGTHSLIVDANGISIDGLGGFALLGAANTFTVGGHVINSSGSAIQPLTINGVAGQSVPVLELQVPSGGVPQLFFDHDGNSGNPSIRWRRDIPNQLGLSFQTVQANGTATEVLRLQDNLSVVAGSYGTVNGLNLGNNNFNVRRGSTQEFSMGTAAGGDQFMTDGRTDTTHQLKALMKSSTTNSRDVWRFNSSWADSTDATRKARTVWEEFDTAAREVMRGEASGSAPMIGFLGAAAIVRPTVSGSRGGNAALASLLTALANLGLVIDSSS